ALLLGPVMSRTGSKQMGAFVAHPTQQDLVFVKELLEAGKVVPVIERRYPLSETAEAIRYLERGHASGKFVITVWYAVRGADRRLGAQSRRASARRGAAEESGRLQSRAEEQKGGDEHDHRRRDGPNGRGVITCGGQDCRSLVFAYHRVGDSRRVIGGRHAGGQW